MQTIALGATGRSTTRLGFGCSSVMGGLGRKDSLSLLESAYEAGIRHFDVAPMYGYGEAEGCVGEFMARHPGRLTVTTKYGIPPAPRQALKSLARSVARPLIKMIPGIKQRLAAAAGSMAQVGGGDAGPVASFSAAEAGASLDRSLKELRVERIDLWLLHEARAVDLKDDGLLRLMQDSVAAGKIGGFGVGSGVEKLPALIAEKPAYCPVLQYDWSVMDPIIPQGAAFRLHHRALTQNFTDLHQGLLARPELRVTWSDQTGADLADAQVLSQLMLKASLVLNPDSVILFSSKRRSNITSNVAVVDDESLVDKARTLYALVQAELARGEARHLFAGGTEG